jgi:hypothetical protein
MQRSAAQRTQGERVSSPVCLTSGASCWALLPPFLQQALRRSPIEFPGRSTPGDPTCAAAAGARGEREDGEDRATVNRTRVEDRHRATSGARHEEHCLQGNCRQTDSAQRQRNQAAVKDDKTSIICCNFAWLLCLIRDAFTAGIESMQSTLLHLAGASIRIENE